MYTKRTNKTPSARRRTVFDVLFTLICLAGAAGGLFLFWWDINQVMLKSSEQPIGVLSYKRNAVQRRFGDRNLWNQLPLETPVYNGDLIRTAELSDAAITFYTGDKIALSENSLINIRYNKKTSVSRIELASGEISVISQSGTIALIAGGQELRSQTGGAFQVKGDQNHIEVQSIAGEIAITSPGGAAYTLEEGKTLNADNSGISEASEAVVMLHPLPNQEQDAGQTNFSWTNANVPADEYMRLEVASDRRFSNVVHTSDNYDPNVTEAEMQLEPGVWWWRMFQAKRGSATPILALKEGRLTVNEPPPPPAPAAETSALVSPLVLAELSAERPITIPAGAVQAAPPPPSAASPPSQAPSPPPPPPRPAPPPLLSRAGGLSPSDGALIDGLYPIVSRISWQPVDFVSRYEISVEIRTQPGVWLEIIRKSSEEEPFVDCPFFAGDYRFRISVYDLLGNPGSSTDWNYFEVRNLEPPPPEVKPEPAPAPVEETKKEVPPEAVSAVPVVQPQYIQPGLGIIPPQEDEKTIFRLEALSMPLVILPFSEFNEIYATSPIQLLGISLRFTALPLRTGAGIFGLDFTTSWNYLANDILHSSRYTNILNLQLSAVWQIRPFSQKTALDFRIGGGLNYIHSRFDFNDGRISENLDSWNASLNAGLSLVFFLNKSLFLDAGMDYFQIFTTDSAILPYLRPVLGLGWWF